MGDLWCPGHLVLKFSFPGTPWSVLTILPPAILVFPVHLTALSSPQILPLPPTHSPNEWTITVVHNHILTEVWGKQNRKQLKIEYQPSVFLKLLFNPMTLTLSTGFFPRSSFPSYLGSKCFLPSLNCQGRNENFSYFIIQTCFKSELPPFQGFHDLLLICLIWFPYPRTAFPWHEIHAQGSCDSHFCFEIAIFSSLLHRQFPLLPTGLTLIPKP